MARLLRRPGWALPGCHPECRLSCRRVRQQVALLTASSLIGSVPTILLYLFLQRYYVEGLARGVVKG